jgi:SAM-dependent methyltransferase
MIGGKNFLASRKESMNLIEMSDLQLPWCLRVAATLRIANLIDTGITDVRELATAAKCDGEALAAVMSYLVSKGVFEEAEAGRFRLNEAATQLLEPALLLGLDLKGIGGRMAGVWSTLPSYVRTGKPAYHEAYGLPFWQDLEAHPDIAASFDAMIGPQGHGDFNGDFELTDGWGGVRSLVDVGGGTGAMLAAILSLRPHVRGILVDLPLTVGRAAEVFRAAGIEHRVATSGQSFFAPLPPGADIYLLRGVLNDWGDAEAQAILRRCAEAAKPDGRVVILKGVRADAAPRSLSIEHVIAGGKSRSVADFEHLAQSSGLELLAAGPQPSGYFVVECGVVR